MLDAGTALGLLPLPQKDQKGRGGGQVSAVLDALPSVFPGDCSVYVTYSDIPLCEAVPSHGDFFFFFNHRQS